MDYQQWENPVTPKILESRRWTCTLQDLFSERTKSKQDYELIQWNVSKLPSVDILLMGNVIIHTIVSIIENYENRTVTPISFICEGRVGILLTCGKHLHDHFIYTRQIVFWIRFVKWVECIWFVSQNLGGHIYTSQRSCTLSEDTILGSISIF